MGSLWCMVGNSIVKWFTCHLYWRYLLQGHHCSVVWKCHGRERDTSSILLIPPRSISRRSHHYWSNPHYVRSVYVYLSRVWLEYVNIDTIRHSDLILLDICINKWINKHINKYTNIHIKIGKYAYIYTHIFAATAFTEALFGGLSDCLVAVCFEATLPGYIDILLPLLLPAADSKMAQATERPAIIED